MVPDIGLVVDTKGVVATECLKGGEDRLVVRPVVGRDNNERSITVAAHGHKHLGGIGVALKELDGEGRGGDGFVAFEDRYVGCRRS